MNSMQDKVCIVTGAALGIGRACATKLAEEGARVALFDVLDTEGAAVNAKGVFFGVKYAIPHLRDSGAMISPPHAGRWTRRTRLATSVRSTTSLGAWSTWLRTRRNSSPAPNW